MCDTGLFGYLYGSQYTEENVLQVRKKWLQLKLMLQMLFKEGQYG